MISGLLFLFLLYYAWNNFYDIMVFINEKMLLVKDFYYKNNTSYNSFKKISTNIITSKGGIDILVYEYHFRGDNYVVLYDTNKSTNDPYTKDYIDSQQKKETIEILKKTKDDIISAELIIKDKSNNTLKELDYISETQKLSGPLGDFYEDTSAEMKKEYLLIYLEYKFDAFEIKELNIMTSDGEEFNILE
jgi:hypothetical protein